MKMNKRFIGLLAGMALFGSCHVNAVLAEPMPNEQLNQLAEEAVAKKPYAVGYPVNQNLMLRDFYDWFIKTGLCNVCMNNVGDPFDPHIALSNSLNFEREVIEFFAPLYGFTKDNVWGIMSMSGTDGNNHGIYFGYNYLEAVTKQEPIMYVSTESHYSNKRLADLQNIEVRLIECDKFGAMLPEAFKKAFDPTRPALVVFSMGTTFKGGIDDQPTINKIIDDMNPVAVYRHVDAALFGGYLPYTELKELVDRNVCRYDSIAISGHKFFGMDEPCGLFLTTKDVLAKQNSYDTPYLNGAMPMINCSRSALQPLKMYWLINEYGKEGYEADTKKMLENAQYLHKRLTEAGWPAWLGKGSNTVFFKRPSEIIMDKYGLCPEYDDRFGGNLAHMIVMQHVEKAIIDEFVNDIISLK